MIENVRRSDNIMNASEENDLIDLWLTLLCEFEYLNSMKRNIIQG